MTKNRNKWEILLVDDEEDIREVLSMSLSDIGYHVLEAKNGKEAIQIFKDVNPPIVLTDIKMPGVDGIELLQEIKRGNPDTEVIMITGHGDMDLAIKSLQHEATDFVTKPINIDALDIALKRVHDNINLKGKLKEYTENLESLVREKTELQDHLSSLGLMIGSISHGIKGLLTSLDGSVYLMDSGFKKKDVVQTKEGFESIKFISSRIRKMILDILFYAKERELVKETIDVLGFVNSVVNIIKPKIQNRPIAFITDYNEGPQQFKVDPDFLRSALINILDNAVDVCLEDESKDRHQITFALKKDKAHTIIKISDDGIGMDDDTKENLFKLFFSSKGGKGTGFGLFIANNIIKQHGGTINVNSVKGKGSVFTIKIPQ